MGAPSTEEALAEDTKAKARAKKKSKDGVKNKIKNKKEKQKSVEEIISRVRESLDDKESRTLEELDFWMPPDGERWDFDDGGDRWGSEDESEEVSDGEHMAVEDENSLKESEELSNRYVIGLGETSKAERQ